MPATMRLSVPYGHSVSRRREPMPVIAITVGLRTLSNVLVPFAVLYMRQPIKLDYLWTALCIPGAVHFIFRSPT